MIDEDDEFTDGDEFEELSASVLADGGKKCTIFLVDASPKMFEKYKSVDSESDCSFRRALKIVRLQMVNKAVTSAFGEYTCCILLNTQIKSHSIDHVYVMQEIEEVSAERIKELDQLLKSENILSAFKAIYGGHGHCDYSEALFLCIKRMTSRTPYFRKRTVYLFTNEMNLFGANNQHRVAACKNADDLRNHNTEFLIFPLITENDTFVFNILEQFDPDVEKNFTNIGELEKDIPKKQYAHRNITGMNFEFGNGLKFSVGIYSLLHSEKIPQPAILNAEKNEIMQRSYIYVNKESNEEIPILDKEIILKRQIGGEVVDLSTDEVEKLRRLTPPGMVLLGFKPLSCLKITHHVRSSQFVYPLEKDILGSTRMYRTLYEVCMNQRKMIICRYTQKTNVPPKLVALVPQASVAEDNSKDEFNSKFRYPGFHLIYLPFTEDKRDFSEQMTHPDGDWPAASKEQIEVAKKLVKKLTSGYFPEKFYNPVLQKHYKVIEALALDCDEIAEVQDQIQPYFAYNNFRKRVEKELDEFRSCLLSESCNSEQKCSKEAKKTDHISNTWNTKRKKSLDESLLYLASNHLLEKMTVTQLKKKAIEELVYIKPYAKKADIIDAIEKHYRST
ncbi:ATP-dependent DNA helicase II, 70 kDa subunit, putative [Brugia malayi]|uniref:ATP-dependent DNA helicase 2 subunit 1 n=1 Tax=Brugia malayi TaxID=6279 RepID=A0A4E9F578_BRUMA|nr:ATP-dependent DNA helicase II, 70 kDa subunit, putative [Brugia malayi]VIO91064.1 ATP-dependent DNA helicase II, 70 kDa subunit, putative [Brugia malayi]